MNDGPRIAVVTFPGSNDDGDAALALELLGAEPVRGVARRDGTPGRHGWCGPAWRVLVPATICAVARSHGLLL